MSMGCQENQNSNTAKPHGNVRIENLGIAEPTLRVCSDGIQIKPKKILEFHA